MSDNTPDLARHTLSPSTSDKVFTSQILPFLLADAEPQANPHAVLLTGQHGSNLAVAADQIARQEFPRRRGQPVIVDSNRLCKYHPDYLKLLARHGAARAQQEVAGDVGEWLERTVATIAERRLNAIITTNFDSPEQFESLVTRLAGHAPDDNPYHIEAHFLAAHTAESWLGWLARYHAGYQRGFVSELLPDRVLHDTSYTHLPTVAQWADADHRIGAVAIQRFVTVPRSNPRKLWDTDAERHQFTREVQLATRKERARDGSWRSFRPSGPVSSTVSSTPHALEAWRNQPWNELDSRDFQREYERLCAQMRPDHWGIALDLAHLDAVAVLSPKVQLFVAPFDPQAADLVVKEAVFVGDFPVVTNADLVAVTALALEHGHVDIAIIDETAEPSGTLGRPTDATLDLYNERARNAQPKPNPLSLPERQRAWETALLVADLKRDMFTVTAVARPDMYPKAFNARYPHERTDAYMLTHELPHFRVALDRRIEKPHLPPGHERPSIEDLAERYQRGDETWDTFLAPGASEVFRAADGPQRLFPLYLPADKNAASDLVAATALTGTTATADAAPTAVDAATTPWEPEAGDTAGPALET